MIYFFFFRGLNCSLFIFTIIFFIFYWFFSFEGSLTGSQSLYKSVIETFNNILLDTPIPIERIYNVSISLNNTANRDAFINSMTSILNTYHFDGIDIDIEHGNSILASGTIANPTSVDCINLIYAINQIKTNYFIA
ncbi:hypothetical protein HGB07_04465, partial [Candidatus Roizmanbacteria bacterium]|nr:hypothetical protein [Candidatus Roizmanbacteria bacterium]